MELICGSCEQHDSIYGVKRRAERTVFDMKEREYLKELGKKITNSSARVEIVKEYEAHIEDCKEALMEAGMTEEEAEKEAVRQMGSPQEAGEAMDKIYHKAIDYGMLIWMVALGFVPAVCVGICYIITKDPDAFFDMWNEALQLDKVPVVIHQIIGTVFAVYGFGLSFWEKYSGKPLFYAVGRDWGRGSYIANSGLVLFIAALCFAPGFPVKGIAGVMSCILIMCVLNMILRAFMNLLQNRRETKLLWEIGTADTEITWKGKGYLCGHHMKVRVQGSEKGTKIPAGAPMMVVAMEGFRPVVAQV